MNHSKESTGFVFHELIDNSQLVDLYDNDYIWIEEIFRTTLENFDGDIAAIVAARENADLPVLRKAIHKIKPVFGFVGMPNILDQCKRAEDKTAAASSMAEIKEDIDELLLSCEKCKAAILLDIPRLQAFNQTGG